MFDGICDILHREMDELEKKYSGGGQMNGQDLEHLDRMAHTLKCLKTYEAMTANEYRPRYSTRDRYERDDGYRRY